METKKMTVADVNMVFGVREEPLIHHIDNIILPSLQQDTEKRTGTETRFIFSDIKIRKMSEDDYALCGLLIKDTIIEVKSEYDETNGLIMTNKDMQSAPYSLFAIYLKNHRMVLVKNQKGSPDIRTFKAALYKCLNRYITDKNKELKKNGVDELLPRPNISVNGITTAQSILEVLRGVEKIEKVILKFNPLNAEWDYKALNGEIDAVRRTIGSKTGKVIFNSPNNIAGVAQVLEEAEGMVEPQIKVRYSNDLSLKGSKKRATIKNSQISEEMNIDIEGELKCAYEQIQGYKSEIKALNTISHNNVVLYEEFLKKRNLR